MKTKRGAPIILYHFCAAQDVGAILREGITKGVTPVWKGDELRFLENTQWLTEEKDPARQSWNTQHVVNYSRTAYRLTVSIPHSHRKKLIVATEFVKALPEENASLTADYPGSEHWYVFRGRILPEWIIGKTKTEEKGQ